MFSTHGLCLALTIKTLIKIVQVTFLSSADLAKEYIISELQHSALRDGGKNHTTLISCWISQDTHVSE